MVLKRRINQHDGKIAEPHSFSCFIHPPSVSAGELHLHTAQDKQKGREGEKDRVIHLLAPIVSR